MDSEEIRSRGRARKRRKKGFGNVIVGRPTRSKALVGRYVRKEFVGNGIFLGKVVSYDSGLYRVNYEDGDFEDLDSREVREVLVEEGEFDEELNTRKKKLDEFIALGNFEIQGKGPGQEIVTIAKGSDMVEESKFSKLSSDIEFGSGKALEPERDQLDCDADSSSDSCEYVGVHDPCSEVKMSLFPPPPSLPPSSGNLGVSEESVSHLLSVYGFLRSFSIQLFLSPFGLDDFVGSLNCVVPNSLLDAINVALLRALRRHLEMLSSNGSELASKCLRRVDWSLLDTLTWPVYLFHYLLVMGYTEGPEWKGFYNDVLDREYYTLSAARKLRLLQILCDDVIESAELRTEIDMREQLEVGMHSDGTAILPPEIGPNTAHPRGSKTSACKDPDAMQIISTRHLESKRSCDSISMGCTLAEEDTTAADVEQDGNSDECQLCGMDGTLVCCDGCPSAYHSRCIGLSKMFLPEGSWFCPECAINKTELAFRVVKGLRGAEIFGMDPYEQVFLSTCNHLIVLKASINGEGFLRYYNQNDIPKVMQVLFSSVQHRALYSEICTAILQYWEIPENEVLSLPFPEEFDADTNLGEERADSVASTPLDTLSIKVAHKVPDMVESKNFESVPTVRTKENGAQPLPCNESNCKGSGFNGTSFGTVTQADNMSVQKNDDNKTQWAFQLMNSKFHEQIGTVSTISVSSGSLQADPSDFTHQSFADRSSALELATCTSGNNDDDKKGQTYCMPIKNGLLSIFGERKEVKYINGGRRKELVAADCIYMGASFKPQAYVNQYILGDVAASSAASLAVLSSEENKISEAHDSSNRRKVMSANISLQVKAFSSSAIRFFWPNSEKKMEVPRERCGWCLSCKAPATSKKGCLLNAAASNALKGAPRILGSLRAIKNGEGNLPGIAAYILYTEESLRGLVIGPFLSASYRKQWRKQVEQASTCHEIKLLLLELEENIRLIALSGGWIKLVDDWSLKSSVAQGDPFSIGSTQKRPVGKRNRKQSVARDVTTNSILGSLKEVIWWRGGRISKLVFQRGVLPCSIVKRAGRQGGSRKIPGIYYTEGSDIPKRSRQFAWRAAVEMTKNASQLALQVRYLDLHIRWSDLVRPEQNFQDVKGSETEASAFRNAVICDKKIQENKLQYALVFNNQKHLPSRVMKNVTEVQQAQDGGEKFWFYETYIPLYLIKEFEENADKMLFLSENKDNKALYRLSDLQRRQLKGSRRDIFSYLMRKGEKLIKCSCASCQQDVMLGVAIKCSVCEGYCHKDCTKPSTVHIKDEVEFVRTCNQCYYAKVLGQDGGSNRNSTSSHLALQGSNRNSTSSHLALQGQACPNAVTLNTGAKQNGYHQQSVSFDALESHSKMKLPTTVPNSTIKGRRGSAPSYGLIWKKKKNCEVTGTNFRLNSILLRGSDEIDSPRRPVCQLCSKPYSSDLMYICCETCRNWFHADAVQLEESKIFDLVGFKCCKCRRQRSPICPYMDVESKPHMRAPRKGSEGMENEPKRIHKQRKGSETSTPVLQTKVDKVMMDENEPLPFSLERVEQLELTSEVSLAGSAAGPQKLPVRRHSKHELGSEGSSMIPYHESVKMEASNFLSSVEKQTSPKVEWDLSSGGPTDLMFDYENLNYEDMDMEFEPQTYFSFTELLASGDDPLDVYDASVDPSGSLENSCGYGEISQSNQLEQYEMSISEAQQSAIAGEPAINTASCQMCKQTAPPPDRYCEICGIWIHNHCSPWVELSSFDKKWRCGQCRDWR